MKFLNLAGQWAEPLLTAAGTPGQGIDTVDSWYEVGSDDEDETESELDSIVKELMDELEDLVKDLKKDLDAQQEVEDDYDRAMDIVVGKKV